MNLSLRAVPAWARVHPRRLLAAPRVELAEGSIRVDGMVCGVCAARTRAALASVTGVEDASVDLDGGVARLRLAPGQSADRDLEAALQRAVERVVVGMGARRWVERAVRGRRGGSR